MYYLDSASMDPAWNLALEQFVFDQLGPREDCFMLWQNDRTIVVGKYQNVLEEINSTYVKAPLPNSAEISSRSFSVQQ